MLVIDSMLLPPHQIFTLWLPTGSRPLKIETQSVDFLGMKTNTKPRLWYERIDPHPQQYRGYAIQGFVAGKPYPEMWGKTLGYVRYSKETVVFYRWQPQLGTPPSLEEIAMEYQTMMNSWQEPVAYPRHGGRADLAAFLKNLGIPIKACVDVEEEEVARPPQWLNRKEYDAAWENEITRRVVLLGRELTAEEILELRAAYPPPSEH